MSYLAAERYNYSTTPWSSDCLPFYMSVLPSCGFLPSGDLPCLQCVYVYVNMQIRNIAERVVAEPG